MLGEVLLLIMGSGLWFLFGYGVGFDHGWKDAQGQPKTDRFEFEVNFGKVLAEPLKCPVCGAGRSNVEITQGWCANCGVYSDGSTDR